MARNMTTFVKDRTLADVQRVKELMAKKYQNMTASEQAEWDGYMKGRFDYTDWNRLGSYIEMIRNNFNAVYHWIDLSYPSPIFGNNAIDTHTNIDTIPGGVYYQTSMFYLFYYVDYTLRYLGFEGISTKDYSYSAFNKLEDKTDFLDNYIEMYATENQVVPTTIAINNTSYGNDPRVSLDDYVATAEENYKVVVHSLLLPIKNATYIFRKATIVDLSKCWIVETLTSANLTKNVIGNLFSNNTSTKKIILPTDKDIELTAPFGVLSSPYPIYEEINTEKIIKVRDPAYNIAGTFENCRNLKAVDFSSYQETTLKTKTFYNCYALTSLILPNTITSFASSCIANCTSLKTINFLGTIAQWNSITKNATWDSGTTLENIKCTDGIININP